METGNGLVAWACDAPNDRAKAEVLMQATVEACLSGGSNTDRALGLVDVCEAWNAAYLSLLAEYRDRGLAVETGALLEEVRLLRAEAAALAATISESGRVTDWLQVAEVYGTLSIDEGIAALKAVL